MRRAEFPYESLSGDSREKFYLRYLLCIIEEITICSMERCRYRSLTETTASLYVYLFTILSLKVIEDDTPIILELHLEWLIRIEDKITSLKIFRCLVEMIESIECFRDYLIVSWFTTKSKSTTVVGYPRSWCSEDLL